MRKIDKKLLSGHLFLSSILKKHDVNSSTRVISFVNPFSYYMLDKNLDAYDIDILFSDGALLTLFHRFFIAEGHFKRASFDYSSIAGDVFDYCRSFGLKVSIIGGAPNELERIKENISNRFTGLDIDFSHHGFFLEEARQGVIQSMSRSDVIVVGMGAPIQEEFCRDIKHTYREGKLIFTCGGFLSQTALKSDYYHPLVKALGVRWLQRAILHKHVRQRLVKEYPLFVIKYVYHHLFNSRTI